jgi:hypothetical protein
LVLLDRKVDRLEEQQGHVPPVAEMAVERMLLADGSLERAPH